MRYIDNTLLSLDRFLKLFASGVLLIAMVVAFVQVISRYFFGHTFSWSEELTRYCNVWITFVVLGSVTFHGEHIRLDLLDNTRWPKLNKLVESLQHIVNMAFFAVLAYMGFKLLPVISLQRSTGIHISMLYVYLVIPFGSLLSAIYSLVHLGKLIVRGTQEGQ